MQETAEKQNSSLDITKVATGIRGLDEVLHGGLPDGRMTLISGGPGTGKTVLALEFLYRGALAGEPGLFVSFEERAESFRLNARALGLDLAGLEKTGRLLVMNPELPAGIVRIGTFDIQGLLAILAGRVKTLGIRRIVLDALDGILRAFGSDEQRRDQLEILHNWLDEQNLTCVLSVKNSLQEDSSYSFLDYMADCVVFLDHRISNQLSTRRLRVVKYRGSGFMSNEYPYLISVGGMIILPVSSVSLTHKPLGERLSSGHPAFDEMLGGGYRRAASILLAGESGTGKTTLASIFANEACRQGERVLYLNFEQSREAMIDAMLSAGIDLRPALKDGLLEIRSAMPEALGVEEHLVRILNIMEAFAPRHFVVDAISACRRMGSEKAAFDLFVRLLSVCKTQGITCLFVNQTDGLDGLHRISGAGISSLIDTAVVLQYMVEAGEIHRKLLVLKSRGSSHSKRFRRLMITGRGIELAEMPAAPEGG